MKKKKIHPKVTEDTKITVKLKDNGAAGTIILLGALAVLGG
jgi:hypothetical protein